MEITRRKRKAAIPASVATDQQLYPLDISLYTDPPLVYVALSEFEEVAIDRLQALRILEMVSLRGIKSIDDFKSTFISELNKEGLKYFAKLVHCNSINNTDADLEARKKDYLSHFILRLVYCQTEELRRWFLKQEIEYFRLRFMSLTEDGIKEFLKINKLNYFPISAKEREKLKDQLYESTPFKSPQWIENNDFYRVPFQLVLNLVQNRKCFLKNGFGYIPHTELIAVVTAIFRSRLSEALVHTTKIIPKVMSDERLNGLIKTLHHSYLGKEDFSMPKNSIDIKSLDNLSRRSFPLCMRQLHMSLRANHHLRHGARQQFGLFLKSIGVTLEDAVRFWREEFTRLMDSDKFEKQYAYNIRHNYGKEGKQTNYTAHSCMKIILNNIGAGDAHGCPFRHNDFDVVKQQMSISNIPPAGIKEVEDYVKGRHYQLACGKYFELSHGALPASGGINHPTQYFEASIKILSERQDLSAVAVAGAVAPKTGTRSVTKKPQPPVLPATSSKVQEDDPWAGDFDISNLPGME